MKYIIISILLLLFMVQKTVWAAVNCGAVPAGCSQDSIISGEKVGTYTHTVNSNNIRLKFVSDNSTTKKGFKLTSPVNWQSPNYPGDYPNNNSTTLPTPIQDYCSNSVQLFFEEFKTEANYDGVCVYKCAQLTLNTCGDGATRCGEQCDNGVLNTDNPVASYTGVCRTNCKTAKCGDGITDTLAGEECDDGNSNDGDLCTNSCKLPTCGDGIKNGFEQCDGNSASCSTLSSLGYFPYSDFTGGTATCNANCTWNVSNCSYPTRNKFVGLKHFAYSNASPSNASKTAINTSDLVNQSLKGNFAEYSTNEWKNDLAAGKKGYFFDLPPDTMIIGSPVFYGGRIYFVTYTKENRANLSGETCDPNFVLGWGYLWEISAFNGLSTGGEGRGKDGNHWWVDDRVKAYLGRGIPSEPTIADDKLVIGTAGDSRGDGSTAANPDKKGPLHDPHRSTTPPPNAPETPGAWIGELPKPPSNPARILWWKVY